MPTKKIRVVKKKTIKPSKSTLKDAKATAKAGQKAQKGVKGRSNKIRKHWAKVAGSATAKLGAHQIAAGKTKKGKKTIAKAKKLYKK